jgi:hypothetical protein
MDIYTYYDSSDSAPERQGEWMRLWERSWRLRGWTPKILTARKARSSPFFSKKLSVKSYPWLAFERVGGGWFCCINQINFGFAIREWEFVNPAAFYGASSFLIGTSAEGALGILNYVLGKEVKIKSIDDEPFPCHSKYLARGWNEAEIVSFESIEDILNCGRSIC